MIKDVNVYKQFIVKVFVKVQRRKFKLNKKYLEQVAKIQNDLLSIRDDKWIQMIKNYGGIDLNSYVSEKLFEEDFNSFLGKRKQKERKRQ